MSHIFGSQESDVPYHAGRHETDVQIGEANGNHAHPGPKHVVFVEAGDPTPSGVVHGTECGAGEAVELASGEMAERVARESVDAEQDDVEEHNERADADAEVALEDEGAYRVVPKEGDEKDCDVEKVAVKILENERKARLAAIFAIARFANGATGRIGEKCAIVGFAVVVARHTETERAGQNQNCRRKWPPMMIGINQGGIKGRKVGINPEEFAFKGAPRGVNRESAEDHGKWNVVDPPSVTTLRATETTCLTNYRGTRHFYPRCFQL